MLRVCLRSSREGENEREWRDQGARSRRSVSYGDGAERRTRHSQPFVVRENLHRQTLRQGEAEKGKIRLPKLVLIGDGFTNEAVAGRIVDAVRGGVPWVHLRDHAAEAAAFRAAAHMLGERLRQTAPDVLLSVNSRLAVAEALGAGLHTGRHGPDVETARRRLGSDMLVGFSAHGEQDARKEAQAAAADYFFFSPVFPTSSKPSHPGAGLDALRDFCEVFPSAPVFALGGVTPGRVASCLDTSAHGVAVLSGILHADDPARATRDYLQAFPDK
jgi:thiamine-phosphate pyrophosphorylase